jgi:hypothetical protein
MEKTKEAMREVGKYIENKFPGIGFALILFPFNSIGDANYISNANRSDMIKSFDEILYRFRGQEENANKIVELVVRQNMNTNTNELVDFSDLKEDEIKEMLNQGFVPIPKELQEEASRELGGKKSVIVKNNRKLLNWAKEQKSTRKSFRRNKGKRNI